MALGKSLAVGHEDKTPDAIVGDPTQAALDEQLSIGASRLAQYWTGAALAKHVKTQQRWIRAQRSDATDGDPNFRPLGGGVSDVTITSTSASDDAISVNADVTQWAAMAQIDDDGEGATIDRPTNIIQVKAQLVKRGNGWLIDEYEWTFAPGSGP